MAFAPTGPPSAALAAHLRHGGQGYPRERQKRVVLVIDHIPWYRGPLVTDALAAHRHLEFYRLPSYSPQLNPIERFGKVLRRRATHKGRFDTLAELKAGVRNSLRYLQTVRSRVKQLIKGRPKKAR